MEGQYRSVHFDLDTKALRKKFGYTAAGYRKMRSSLKEAGFEHRQGSGYRSVKPMTNAEALNFTMELGKKNDWLASCLKSFEMTNSGMNDYDFTDSIREAARVAAQEKQKTVAGENKPESGFSKGLTEMFESRPPERAAASGQEKVASSQNVME